VKACLEAAPARAWLQVAQAALSPERQAVVDTIPAFLDLRTLDGNAALARHDGRTLAAPVLTPDDIAVITFTSGSTGKPKAVEGKHGPLTHFLPWLQEKFGFTEQDRFCMLSGLAHDPLQRDMFTSLCLGASLHIPQEQGISIAHLTPAMSQILADVPEGAELPALRRVFLVGDVLTRRDVQRLQSLAPNVKVVNYYGSTETQRSVSYYEVEHETPSQALREIIPLGSGIPDVQLLLMNTAGQQAGIGEHGEVYMRSANMARGYRADEALTQQRFIVNPFTGNARDRLYRTGDLGRYLPNGMVECLGRADTQVKVRGFRVELGHIESLLGQHDAVREAIVVIRGGANGDKQLVAYVVPNGRAPSVGELRGYLRNSLPDYMQPGAFVFLDSLPLTPNGKVNRGALPAPEFSHDEVAYLAPRTEIEAVLAGIWQELLGLERVGVLDNFFSLGGHSLLGIKLMARIEKAFGCRLPVSQIFLAPSIAALSQRISASDPSCRMLVPLRPQGEDVPVFLIHPLGGEVSAYADLVAAIDENHPVYGIQSAMVAGATIEPYDIDTVCAAYVAEIQSVQPEGPYCLGGWSLGGTLALRCAHQLEQKGHAVRWVALLDTAYRAGRVIAPLTLEQHIGNYLDIAREDILSVYGADAVALQERIRAYVATAGAEKLAHMLQHEQDNLAQELQFELGIQAYLLRDYEVARGNISLASGFQPDVLDAPIHAFWAEHTVEEGVDTSAWRAFTQEPEQSEVHVFPGRHLSFAFGDNANEIGALLNRFLRLEPAIETMDKLPRIAANENGPLS
jgi:amino acid adenylation domain-containing protein